MFEEEFKTELLAFLPKEDVDLLEQDIVSIINKFPLDTPKKKNYLNILINIFLRYRTQSSDVNDIVQLPYLEIGSNPKEIVLKQNKIKINFFEFKNISKYFTESDLSHLEKYFQAIGANVSDVLSTIDFSRNSLEQRLSRAINDQKEKIFDLDGMFYSYIHIDHTLVKNEMFLPERKDNDEVLDLINNMVRFYAWSKSSLSWDAFLTSEREIQSLSDQYQSLQWFLDGYYKRSTPFNVHSPKRYSQYLEAIKSSNFKQYNKRINEVFTFTNSLVSQIKDLYSLLNNSPFAVQKENKSDLYDVFKKVIGLQFSQEQEDSYSLESISRHFNTLKIIFDELGLSIEEFYELNTANILNSLMILIINQIANKELPVEFPFTLIWEPKNKDFIDKYYTEYNLSLDSSDLQMFEFLVEYTNGGVTKQNFSSYFKKMDTIIALQKNLFEIGDIADYDVVKFTDSDYLSSKEGPYDFMDFKKLSDIESSIRQSLNNLKRLWIHDISGDPIFMNDASFKKYFPLHLGKEKIEYVSEIEEYLNKWNEYKESSDSIKKIQETIKIVSTIKLKLEGEELVTSDYPGAISLIKAQKLINRENNRLLLKLKELISSVAKFKFTEGFSSSIDPKILNSSDEQLISNSISIIEQIASLATEVSSVDVPTLTSELKVFTDYIKKLLGSESRISQLKKFSETLEIRYNKLKADNVVINTGLHFINLNDSITNIVSILKDTNELLQKFYSHSFSQDLFNQMNVISKTHNLQEIISSITQTNQQLEGVVSNLSGTFAEVSTYFDVFADIAFQLMQKYGRLVSKNDLFMRLDKSRINFYEDQGSIVITDKIDEGASILEKQLFMEKTFSLYTHLSRACNQINFALSKSFSNLANSAPNSIEKIDRSLDVKTKVDVIMKNVDNFYKFLDSIHFVSRKQIQTLKTSLKNVVSVIAPVKASNKLAAELSNANKLINALSKSKGTVNYGLMRKLNDSLNRILKFIDSSVLDYFKDITDETKKKEILTAIDSESAQNYPNKINTKVNKIRKLVSISREDLLSAPVSEVLSKKDNLADQTVEPSVEQPHEPVIQQSEPTLDQASESVVEEVAETVAETIEEEVVEQAVAEASEEAVVEESVEETVADAVVEEAVDEVAEEVAEAVVEEAIEQVAEEAAVEEIVEEVAEEIIEEKLEEGTIAEVTEAEAEEAIDEAIEEVAEAVVEEQVEEAFEKELLEESAELVESSTEEPEVNQLEDEESGELDLEDSYEPETDQKDETDDGSDDLISEMEKLLNVKEEKEQKK